MSPSHGQTQDDRRRHSRFPLGLPVRLHVSGRDEPLTVELVDIGKGGVRFRALEDGVSVDQRAAFAFVVAGEPVCAASGRVLRVAGGGEFIVSLDEANPAFHAFLKFLSAA
jgi:hypothetical protein